MKPPDGFASSRPDSPSAGSAAAFSRSPKISSGSCFFGIMIPPAILGGGTGAGVGRGTDAAGFGAAGGSGGVGPPDGGGAIGATGKFAGGSSNILVTDYEWIIRIYELRIHI